MAENGNGTITDIQEDRNDKKEDIPDDKNDLPNVTEGTDSTDITDVNQVTDATNVTDVTEASDATDVIDVTAVAEVSSPVAISIIKPTKTDNQINEEDQPEERNAEENDEAKSEHGLKVHEDITDEEDGGSQRRSRSVSKETSEGSGGGGRVTDDALSNVDNYRDVAKDFSDVLNLESKDGGEDVAMDLSDTLMVPTGLTVRRGSRSCPKMKPVAKTPEKTYYRKVALTEKEVKYNKELFQEVINSEFPVEDMQDIQFRSKDKDWVLKAWIIQMTGERFKIGKSEFDILLQSGVVLCYLAVQLIPEIEKAVSPSHLQSNSYEDTRHNISLFLSAARLYGVPENLLFRVDDLAHLEHVHKVTRCLFALGELTKQDPYYTGPEFDYDDILRKLVTKGGRRRSSSRDMSQAITNIFINYMQDVSRKTNTKPRGPPKDIYYPRCSRRFSIDSDDGHDSSGLHSNNITEPNSPRVPRQTDGPPVKLSFGQSVDRQESVPGTSGRRSSNPDLEQARHRRSSLPRDHENARKSSVPPEKDRKGSSTRQLKPLADINKPNIPTAKEIEKTYFKKKDISEVEWLHNKTLFNEIINNEFPTEDMEDASFRDKEKDNVLKTWIGKVTGEEYMEDYDFVLQSGLILCNLITKLMPSLEETINPATLTAGSREAKRKNINLFLTGARQYGVPQQLLFNVDDIAVLAHVHKVTRMLFALAELTRQDPDYQGPEFDYEEMLRQLRTKEKERTSMQGVRRKSTLKDMPETQHRITDIFANLMQDVERKSTFTPKGPPKNIYSQPL